jgi:hypothetical protein
MKKKTDRSVKGLLIFFFLLASVIFTPSEYVDCQSLFPDENLDFLGISVGSQNQSQTCRVSVFIRWPSASTHSWNSPFSLEICLPQLINSRMALTTILRC